MIWFYHRGADTMKIETRYNALNTSFELIWHHPDGSRTIEAFQSEALFRERSQAVEASLAQDSWALDGAPAFDPDGWKRG